MISDFSKRAVLLQGSRRILADVCERKMHTSLVKQIALAEIRFNLRLRYSELQFTYSNEYVWQGFNPIPGILFRRNF